MSPHQAGTVSDEPLVGRLPGFVQRSSYEHHLVRGTFDISLAPGPTELDGAVTRFEFTKTFKGDFEGTSTGVMLSAGDPQRGAAGYVAVESVRGKVADREGSFVFQQFGTLLGGSQTLHDELVPDRASLA